MKRWMILLFCCLLLPAMTLGEGGVPFMEDCASFLDDNGVDTVFRPLNQPFMGETAEGELVAFMDYVEDPNQDTLYLRLTLSVAALAPLPETPLTLQVGQQSWTMDITPILSEYDAMYYGDYCIPLVGDEEALLQALMAGKAPLILTVGEVFTGRVEIPAAEVKTMHTRLLAALSAS